MKPVLAYVLLEGACGDSISDKHNRRAFKRLARRRRDGAIGRHVRHNGYHHGDGQQRAHQSGQGFAQTHSAAGPLQHHDVTEQLGNPVAVGLRVEQGPVGSALVQAKELILKVVGGAMFPLEDHHAFLAAF